MSGKKQQDQKLSGYKTGKIQAKQSVNHPLTAPLEKRKERTPAPPKTKEQQSANSKEDNSGSDSDHSDHSDHFDHFDHFDHPDHSDHSESDSDSDDGLRPGTKFQLNETTEHRTSGAEGIGGDIESDTDQFNHIVSGKYARDILKILYMPFYSYFKYLFNSSADEYEKILSKTGKPGVSILIIFQRNLSLISKWDKEKKIEVYKSIKSEGVDGNTLRNLITGFYEAFKSEYLRTLTFTFNEKNVHFKCPSNPKYIYMCLRNIAREFWKKPYLFVDGIPKNKKDSNMAEIRSVIATMIASTMVDTLPVNEIFENQIEINKQHHDSHDSHDSNDSRDLHKHRDQHDHRDHTSPSNSKRSRDKVSRPDEKNRDTLEPPLARPIRTLDEIMEEIMKSSGQKQKDSSHGFIQFPDSFVGGSESRIDIIDDSPKTSHKYNMLGADIEKQLREQEKQKDPSSPSSQSSTPNQSSKQTPNQITDEDGKNPQRESTKPKNPVKTKETAETKETDESDEPKNSHKETEDTDKPKNQHKEMDDADEPTKADGKEPENTGRKKEQSHQAEALPKETKEQKEQGETEEAQPRPVKRATRIQRAKKTVKRPRKTVKKTIDDTEKMEKMKEIVDEIRKKEVDGDQEGLRESSIRKCSALAPGAELHKEQDKDQDTVQDEDQDKDQAEDRDKNQNKNKK